MLGPDFLKKAQEMQEKMMQMQQDLAEKTVTGSSGGRLVTVTMTGRNEMRSIHIDPSLLKNESPQMIEDLIVAATNDALNKAQILAAQSMGEIAGFPGGNPLGALGLPGF
jgi:DNA-binding YbaB/EbfC family protein